VLQFGGALAMVLLKLRNFDAKDLVELPPSGNLRQRLLTRVTEIIPTGNQLAAFLVGIPTRHERGSRPCSVAARFDLGRLECDDLTALVERVDRRDKTPVDANSESSELVDLRLEHNSSHFEIAIFRFQFHTDGRVQLAASATEAALCGVVFRAMRLGLFRVMVSWTELIDGCEL
jgi:hypothetical protein